MPLYSDRLTGYNNMATHCSQALAATEKGTVHNAQRSFYLNGNAHHFFKMDDSTESLKFVIKICY